MFSTLKTDITVAPGLHATVEKKLSEVNKIKCQKPTPKTDITVAPGFDATVEKKLSEANKIKCQKLLTLINLLNEKFHLQDVEFNARFNIKTPNKITFLCFHPSTDIDNNLTSHSETKKSITQLCQFLNAYSDEPNQEPDQDFAWTSAVVTLNEEKYQSMTKALTVLATPMVKRLSGKRPK